MRVPSTASAIDRRTGASAPLSVAQEQIWLHGQLAGPKPMYNDWIVLERSGPLDVAVLERTLEELVRRHEAWRTAFRVVGGRPLQVVREPFRVPVRTVDLRGMVRESREAEWLRVAAAHVLEPFDLAVGPLVRALLITLDDHEYRLCLTQHHLVFDGVSVEDVILPELVAIYSAFPRGLASPLPEPAIGYADFATWERQTTNLEETQDDLAYWRKQLTDLPPLDLAPNLAPADDGALAGAHHVFQVPFELAKKLEAVGRGRGATLYATLLAAFVALLHRYQGHDSAVVGTVTAARTQPELAQMVGCFVRTLVLRVDMTGNPTFLDLLTRARRVTWEALSHDKAPFQQVVRELRPALASVRPPFFQAMVTLLQHPDLPDGWRQFSGSLPTGIDKFDLHLDWISTSSALVGRIDYDSRLFDDRWIERMASHLNNVVGAVAANPAQRIGDLSLLTPEERDTILVRWNDTRREYPRDASVPRLFEEQARSTPDSIALTFGPTRVTYAELNARANRLARYLTDRGLEPGTLAGVLVERSIEMVVAVLAALKAGAGYLPLDPRYPADRLRFILDDAKASHLLTNSALISRLGVDEDAAGHRVVLLDNLSTKIAGQDAENLSLPVTADDVAYVTYTSGSTGRPKGVVVPHRGVVRLVKGQDYVELNRDDVLLQFAPLAFDASTFEIWGALLNGARLVIHPPHTPTLEELGALLERESVTTLWLTAPLFHEMVEGNLEGLRHVRQLLAGGDVLSPEHVRRLLDCGWGTVLTNGYGPTENTTFTTCHRVTAGAAIGRSVPIGRPIANTVVYVLDRYRQPCPVGVAGELYIGGDGLAKGYLNRPELTAERFVTAALPGAETTLLYRSGDRVRFRPDGALDFLGRLDNQVKIRGFRVEPGEVEAALMGCESVAEAAVIVTGNGSDKRLEAYVAAAPGRQPTAASLRAELGKTLPAYMVPASFVFVEKIPRTASGKLDRGAVGSLRREGTVDAFAPSRAITAVEEALAEMWRGILGTRSVAPSDNFFELGGDSIQALRLVAAIKARFGIKLPVATLLSAPTIEKLAAALGAPPVACSSSPLIAIQPNGAALPFFCVHPVGGEVLCYAPLAQRLGENQPFYGLRAALDDAGEHLSIERLASWYIDAVVSVQPRGPYQLGGYSLGGVIAYEMARQLAERGEQIRLLAVIDSVPITAERLRPSAGRVVKNAVRRLPSWLGDRHFIEKARFWTWTLGSAIKYGASARASSLDALPDGVLLQWFPEQQIPIARCLSRAYADYSPPPYQGRVSLFRSAALPLLLAEDPEATWERVVGAGGVDTHIVPSSHMRILNEPGLSILAQKLLACLESDEGASQLQEAS